MQRTDAGSAPAEGLGRLLQAGQAAQAGVGAAQAAVSLQLAEGRAVVKADPSVAN
jgi:hypothetical protein